MVYTQLFLISISCIFISMPRSEVYECQSCKQFFFLKPDADDHAIRTGHHDFKVMDWMPSA